MLETQKIEELVLKRIEEKDWSLNPDKDLRLLMEEVGELSREIRRMDTGRERPDEEDAPKEEILHEIACEIGDIFFPLVKIARYYGITLEQAFLAHQEKMDERYKDKEEYDWDMLLEKAEKIATEAHKGQFDKGGNPYIEHPRRVAGRMKMKPEKIVGWLHDVVEDTKWTLEDLRKEGFPPLITEGVDAITKRDGETRAAYLYRVSRNKISRNVKKDGDIQENMDLTRIPNLTKKDTDRVAIYQDSYEILEGAGKTHIYGKTMNGTNWIRIMGDENF